VILPPAYRLVALESVDSTNEEAKRRARAGAEEGTLVWAKEQTTGRGRRGRGWDSPPGNLYLSLVLRPEAPQSRHGELGFVAALAIGATVGALVPRPVDLRYKWPNDVLVSGRKTSGILLESESGADWLILGVGINVTSFPEDTETPATSLRQEGAADATVEAALERFAHAFLVWANRWTDDGFAPVRAAWLGRAQGRGERIRVRLPNETVEGRFADLDLSGALVLETDDGQRRVVSAGEVFAL
jgi:BirA family transcriptional regulator, biotin operon repressor / biotin---[acetyl-CoA-carboxylase] ligase